MLSGYRNRVDYAVSFGIELISESCSLENDISWTSELYCEYIYSLSRSTAFFAGFFLQHRMLTKPSNYLEKSSTYSSIIDIGKIKNLSFQRLPEKFAREYRTSATEIRYKDICRSPFAIQSINCDKWQCTHLILPRNAVVRRKSCFYPTNSCNASNNKIPDVKSASTGWKGFYERGWVSLRHVQMYPRERILRGYT